MASEVAPKFHDQSFHNSNLTHMSGRTSVPNLVKIRQRVCRGCTSHLSLDCRLRGLHFLCGIAKSNNATATDVTKTVCVVRMCVCHTCAPAIATGQNDMPLGRDSDSLWSHVTI